MKLRFEKFRAYFSNLLYSYKISWMSSKKITIIRCAFKALTGIVPVISIYIDKEIIDSLVVLVSRQDSFKSFAFFVVLLQIMCKVQNTV